MELVQALYPPLSNWHSKVLLACVAENSKVGEGSLLGSGGLLSMVVLGTVVSMVTLSAPEAGDVFSAASVALAVMLCTPLVKVLVMML